MVMIEYRVDPRERDNFLTAIGELEYERRRDGGYDWHIFEDAADDGRFVETFLIHSWEEHLRQHERVTVEDRLIQERVGTFHRGPREPVVSHLLATPLPPGAAPTCPALRSSCSTSTTPTPRTPG